MAKRREIKKQAATTKPWITKWHIILGAAIMLATLLVYVQVHNFAFVRYDDGDYIFNNQNIRNGITADSIRWAFSFDGYAANWHPLTWISHMLDYQLYGLKNPGGHHITSMIIHILSTLFLFLALSKMTGSVWKSAFVAVLFGIHPVHAESVAWVSERKDVLSTFFMMLTLLAYAFYAEKRTPGRYLAALGLFVLGLMAKPMLVTLPFVLLLLDWWPLGRFSQSSGKKGKRTPISSLLAEKIPFFALVVVSSIITVIVQHKGGAVQALATYSMRVRIENALVAYVSYIGKTIWPTRLAVFYPHPGTSLPALEVLVAGFVLVAASVGAFALAKKHPYVGMGWLLFLGMLVPVIGIVQVGWQAMADRYTYVPVIGLFIIAAWGIPDLVDSLLSKKGEDGDIPPNPKLRTAVLGAPSALVLVAVFCLGYAQVSTWHDNITLFKHAIDTNMNNRLAAINLGVNFADLGQYEDAEKMLGRAVEVFPGDAYGQCNYANALVYVGKIDEAIVHYNKAVKLDGKSDLAHSGLGRALYEQAVRGGGDLSAAEAECRKAIKINPDNPHAHNNLGMVLGKHGADAASAGKRADALTYLRESMTEFEEAIRLKPDFPEALTNVGILDVLLGKPQDAVSRFDEALSYNGKFIPALNRKAETLYSLQDYSASWALVHKVQDLGGQPNPNLVAALGSKMPEPQK